MIGGAADSGGADDSMNGPCASAAKARSGLTPCGDMTSAFEPCMRSQLTSLHPRGKHGADIWHEAIKN